MKIKILAVLVAAVALSAAAPSPRPGKINILWLTSEDNNTHWVGCYGNPHADTPNLDALARDGFQYMHCYANVPVCAPERSTWITGIHAISTGTLPMRSRYPIPHDTIKYYPDHLKAAGYYVANARKTDFNIGGRDDKSAWDSSKVDWKVLKEKQPWFQIFNSTTSHESHAFGDVTKTTHKPEDTTLWKYHPDIPVIRQNYAHYHDEVKKMDAEMGRMVKALEASGMADNTIIAYCSDHGGVLPRSKRFLFDSGTHCPLIIRIPETLKHLWPAAKPGTKIDRIVSFIDMPKTWLSLAGAKVPEVMQGNIFLGPDAEPERKYHVSYRERMDERMDNARAIRNRHFLYIRNYMPYVPWGQPLNYLWKMKATQAWEAEFKAGRTDAVSGRWFKPKAVEELYDTVKDPDNIVNLAKDPKYADVLNELRAALRKWQLEIHDSAMLPEAERVRRATEHKTTIYEMVRNPKLYDLEAYLDASDLALQQDPANLPKLLELLDHADSGVRYWASVGIFMVAKDATSAQDRIRKALQDDSHEVRAMAAWTLHRQGDRAACVKALNDLLRENSYAALIVCNIIDWLGEGVDDYREAIQGCTTSHIGYVNRMKQRFGIPGASKKKRKK